MDGTSTTDEEDFVEAGAEMPAIRAAELEAEFHVRIEWDDGREEVVDLKPAIFSHRAYVPLRNDRALFGSFKVRDRGDSLVWSNGTELSADWISELSPRPLDNVGFRDAMSKLQLSLDGMAARLGIARRLVADYRKDRPIPTTVALATFYLLEHQHRAE